MLLFLAPHVRVSDSVLVISDVLTIRSENEVSGAEAEHLINAGVKYVAEGSNMVSIRNAFSSHCAVPSADNMLSGLYPRGCRPFRRGWQEGWSLVRPRQGL